MTIQKKKVGLVVCLELMISAGFIIGADWAGRETYILFQSYYADFFLPFGFYFLLSIKSDSSRFFNTWWKKALAVFTLMGTSETLQFFGIYALARVFDPFDYLMYGLGVLIAAFFDTKIFSKMLSFWE